MQTKGQSSHSLVCSRTLAHRNRPNPIHSEQQMEQRRRKIVSIKVLAYEATYRAKRQHTERTRPSRRHSLLPPAFSVSSNKLVHLQFVGLLHLLHLKFVVDACQLKNSYVVLLRICGCDIGCELVGQDVYLGGLLAIEQVEDGGYHQKCWTAEKTDDCELGICDFSLFHDAEV